MGDPGFVPGVIGVSIQMLVNKMIEWIERAARCETELNKLKDLLHLIRSNHEEMQKYADRISSLPSPVHSWLTQLKDILQRGNRFVEEFPSVPPRWQIIARSDLTKRITQFTSDLRDHLDSNSSVIILLLLHFGVAIEQLRQDRESRKQIIPSPGDVLPATSSSTEKDINVISMRLCFLCLAAHTEEEVITTERAIKHWITEGLVAGPDHLRTGQTYANMLADHCLIEPIWKDNKGDVRGFKMPDDFHDLAHQIVEEEKRLLRTVRDSQEFSCDERLNALVKVLVKRGTNLAIRDKYFKRSSDPYVVAILNDQKMETRVKGKNLNPVWNQELSLTVQEPQSLLLKLEVYDKDTFSRDDPMGYGEVDLSNLARAARILRKTQSPSLATMNTAGLCIECVDGHMMQKVCVKLDKVESGELYLDIKWVWADQTYLFLRM